MKIALCFAGQPRFIDRMNFDNLIQDHEVVTYAHFWWDESYRGDMFAWNSDLKYPDDYDPIADFEEKMKPKDLKWEEYPKFDLSGFKMVSRMESPLTDKEFRVNLDNPDVSYYIDIRNFLTYIINEKLQKEEVVRQSVYRQKCQWTSVKNAVHMVDEDFDLVIRMRTDLEFPDRVPLEECEGDGLSMMNGSYQAGVGRDYCDWFYCGAANRVQQFDPLKVYDEFYKNGIRHMHELVIETLRTLQIPHQVLDLNAWMTDRSKVK